MANLVFNVFAYQDEDVWSGDPTYATARTGAALTVQATATTVFVGQDGVTGPTNWWIYEGLLQFDTSWIPTSTVSVALKLSTVAAASATSLDTLQVCQDTSYNLAGTTSDWYNPTNFTALTSIGSATFPTATGAYSVTLNAGTLARDATLLLVLQSQNWVNNVQPSATIVQWAGFGSIDVAGTTDDPYIEVTTTGTTTTPLTANGSVTIPTGVTEATFECWGAGGAGGGGTTAHGGGGGGAYSRNTASVSAGQVYDAVVPAGGTVAGSNPAACTWTLNGGSAVCSANSGANSATTASGAGGTATAVGSTADISWAGGAGGTTSGTTAGRRGGGGGGGAGNAQAGSAGTAGGTITTSRATGGAGGVTGGGAGGDSGFGTSGPNNVATAATAPAGGGAGGSSGSAAGNSTNGARAEAWVSWITPASTFKAGVRVVPQALMRAANW